MDAMCTVYGRCPQCIRLWTERVPASALRQKRTSVSGGSAAPPYWYEPRQRSASTITFAVGAGDKQQILLLLKAARAIVGHIDNVGGGQPQRRGMLGQFLAEGEAIAGLAAVEDGQRSLRSSD